MRDAQVLYLHGNRLASLAPLRRLAALPRPLAKLTAHGNPVAQRPGYRAAVTAALPGLRSLDFSPVTKLEREAASAAAAAAAERRRAAEV